MKRNGTLFNNLITSFFGQVTYEENRVEWLNSQKMEGKGGGKGRGGRGGRRRGGGGEGKDAVSQKMKKISSFF